MTLTFTFAGDEAGDASLNFEKGASRYFVFAVVATQDADGLRSALGNLRKRENFSQGFGNYSAIGLRPPHMVIHGQISKNIPQVAPLYVARKCKLRYFCHI
ncbi:MAG: hypothetical protein HZB18_08125 [Chloroflexi bacterium]|nr:hypothetical protein [Chloroflexota bacterium]